MLATQRRTDATEVADGRAEATPDISKAGLRIDLYRRRCERLGARTFDERAALFKGVHRATIARLERRQIEPRLGMAMQMSKRLGVSVDRLWLDRGEVA